MNEQMTKAVNTLIEMIKVDYEDFATRGGQKDLSGYFAEQMEKFYDNINELIAPENIDYSINYKKVNLLLSKMYWYDRKVFEIINSGESIATLSKKTGIVYHSLYNTYIKVKNEIKKIL